MTTLKTKQKFICRQCKHYWEMDSFGVHFCDAFPNGIPEAIVFGLHDHHEPYPGDNDVRFEAKEKASAEG